MKSLISVIFVISTLFLSSDLLYSQNSEVRDFSKIDEINLAVSANLYYKQGSEQKVEFRGPKDMIEKIETEMRGSELVIKKRRNNIRIKDVKIYITTTDIRALKISGSGNISSDSDINTTNMDLAISGSGDIDLDELNAKNIEVRISGSGDVEIHKGKEAEDLEVSTSGSGDFSAENVPAKEVSVAIAGSGNAEVNSTDRLNVRIAGSGDVTYKGRPVVNSKVSGSGSVSGR